METVNRFPLSRYLKACGVVVGLLSWVAGAWAQAVPVRTAQAEVHDSASGSVESPIPFLAVGLLPLNGAASGTLEIRGVRDDSSATAWSTIDLSASEEAHLVPLGENLRRLEYRYAGPAGAPAIRFTFIDPGRTPAEQLTRIRKNRQRAAAVNKPAVISRLDWGCPDGNLSRGPFVYTTVTHLIIHHTGDSFPNQDYAAWVRAIWAYHVNSNGWIDIGYNYLIAPDGAVYEGRAGGDNVLGAHFSCQNSGTMGVSILGTYTTQTPTDATIASLEQVLAWRAGVLKIDPLGSTLHKGMNTVLPNIASHRDGNNLPGSCTVTECPGDVTYSKLGQIRQDVANLLAATTPAILFTNVEGGAEGWTAGGLWHISPRRSSSPARSWWYGLDATGNYNTGDRTNGTLESPVFTLTSDAILTFRSWQETEYGSAYDQKWVEASVDGADWVPLLQLNSSMREWSTVTLTLTQRGNVKVRFRFDSVDGLENRYEGWYVDDIRIVPAQ